MGRILDNCSSCAPEKESPYLRPRLRTYIFSLLVESMWILKHAFNGSVHVVTRDPMSILRMALCKRGESSCQQNPGTGKAHVWRGSSVHQHAFHVYVKEGHGSEIGLVITLAKLLIFLEERTSTMHATPQQLQEHPYKHHA